MGSASLGEWGGGDSEAPGPGEPRSLPGPWSLRTGAPGTLGKLLAWELAPPSIDGAIEGLQVTQESLVPLV